MPEHIGKILQEKLQEPGAPTTKDFANLLGTSVRKLYNLFNGQSDLTFKEVVKASEILNVDLITEYLRVNDKLAVVNEPAHPYNKTVKVVSFSINLTAPFDATGKFPDFLQDINDAAIKYGFQLK